MRFPRLALLLAVSFYGPATLEAQRLAHLPPLHGEALAFDAARGRIVAAGGRGPDGWFAGTWEWDGRWWQRTADSAGSPPPRAGHVMQFDPVGRRMVLFGGMTGPPPALLCDTWVFRSRSWTRLSGNACPTDRGRNAGLVFHRRLGVMLLAEGPAIGNDTLLRPLRLWRLTDSGWVPIDSSGPRRTGFSALAYDEARDRLVVPVLYGGPDAGVWEWDGRNWSRTQSLPPGARQTYGLTYDAGRKRVVLLGGQGSSRGPYLADGWSWDGKTWSPLPGEATYPPGRGGATLLADPRHGRLFYFGGYDTLPLPGLWVHDRDGWRRPENP